MSKYLIDGDTLNDIADAIRLKTMEEAGILPVDMADKIDNIHTGMEGDCDIAVLSEENEWTRPAGWPDLDSIEIPDDFDGVYCTYDLSMTKDYGWIGVYGAMALGGTYTVERGHLENGTFISDFSESVNNKGYFRQELDESNGLVQLWRITTANHFTRISWVGSSPTSAQTRQNYIQPMVERRGILPWVTDLTSSNTLNATAGMMGTAWLKRDNLIPGANSIVTSLGGMYMYCFRLESVNLNWNTANWRVTNMTSLFSECYQLRSVDFSSWDTSNWRVTSLSYAFNWCVRLKSINLTPWNVSNWLVTTMQSMFLRCMSAEQILLDGWDTSQWAITNLNSTFAACFRLKKIDLCHLDTSNWKVTNIANIFQNCLSLRTLDLSKLDTSGWAVKQANHMFDSCASLWQLKPFRDTSNWAVTSLASAFQYLYSLLYLDLSHWETSKWEPATIASAFLECRSLRYLNLSGWDTSAWPLTNISGLFQGCRCLNEIIGLDEFVTSAWPLQKITSLFSQCWSLKRLDLSGWQTSTWVVDSFAGLFNECTSLEEIKGIEDWDVSNCRPTALSTMFPYCMSLRKIDLSKWDASEWPAITTFYNNMNYSRNEDSYLYPTGVVANVTSTTYHPCLNYCIKDTDFINMKMNTALHNTGYCLSRWSLLNLLNKLEIVTEKRTIQLGQLQRTKLKEEELAIATEKGWTVT